MKTSGARFGVGAILAGLMLQFSAVPEVRAAETFDYPELTVTPRASDRLEMEAKKEDDRKFTTYLPIQASALATLVAGIVQSGNTDPSKDASGNSSIAGIAVGGAWLGLTGVLMWMDEPYSGASKEVNALPHKTVREQLTRERMAEEAINKRARLGRTLKWLSVTTNAFANIYMLSNGNDHAKVFDGVALAASIAPVIFRFHWEDVAQEQEEYKKRIYSPVARATLFKEPGAAGSYVPGLQLSLRF